MHLILELCTSGSMYDFIKGQVPWAWRCVKIFVSKSLEVLEADLATCFFGNRGTCGLGSFAHFLIEYISKGLDSSSIRFQGTSVPSRLPRDIAKPKATRFFFSPYPPQQQPSKKDVHRRSLTFLPLKNDGWKRTFLLGRAIFRGELLNFQVPACKHSNV